jgi:hypothetical protein
MSSTNTTNGLSQMTTDSFPINSLAPTYRKVRHLSKHWDYKEDSGPIRSLGSSQLTCLFPPCCHPGRLTLVQHNADSPFIQNGDPGPRGGLLMHCLS